LIIAFGCSISYVDFVKGLAYVDFVDDEHLAAAITKNKQLLFGKRLSIARSDPKQNRRDGRRVPREQGTFCVTSITLFGCISTTASY
jgi:RNA recognition motif-containing protein